MTTGSDLRVTVLERENEKLREQVAWLERCLMGSSEVSYAIFGLTAIEERVPGALMSREHLSKDQIMTIVYADRVDADLPEIKIVDVFVCKIRRKLKPFGVDITTLWGRGYAITPKMKEAVRAFVERAGGGSFNAARVAR